MRPSVVPELIPGPTEWYPTSLARFPSSGSGSDAAYVFTQGSALATWSITHGLGKFPSVSVVDTAKDQVEGDVVYLNNNQLEVKFTAPFAGAAYLN